VSAHPPDLVAGRYRLIRQVAEGPMSTVWEAADMELERTVAVKFLAPGADAGRFRREARAGAALEHRNVCRVFDVGESPRGPYLVTEFLAAGSLEDRLRDAGRFADADTRAIAEQVAAGLAHAHAHGVVHRDLKPSNVLFADDGSAKIADFGIAALEGAEPLTDPGTVLGTAAYMSPEQATGQPVTAASDVYSFGVILFRLLTGRLPFAESTDPLAVARAHVSEAAPPVASVRGDAPADLTALADATLAKAPRERPPDGAALAAALVAGRPAPSATSATTVVAGPPVGRRRSRAARAALAAGVLAALALGGFGLARVGHGGSAEQPATPSAPPSATTQPPPAAPATNEAPEPEPAASTPSTTRPQPTAPATTASPTTSTTPAQPVEPPPPPPPPPPTTETAPDTTGTPTTPPQPPPPPAATTPPAQTTAGGNAPG
jgi:serine/threonine-protein kinase